MDIKTGTRFALAAGASLVVREEIGNRLNLELLTADGKHLPFGEVEKRHVVGGESAIVPWTDPAVGQEADYRSRT